jgi:hypothetical protein
MSQEQVVSLGIFYQNDKPGGFGVCFALPEKGEKAVTPGEVLELLERNYQQFLEEQQAHPADAESFLAGDVWVQLRAAAKEERGGIRNMTEKELRDFLVAGCGNVYLLEKLGRLVTVDEYNGCVIAWLDKR